MKTIVLYKSRTGFTKRYGEWISQELNCEIADYNERKNLDLDDYQLIIYGGRVHAGKIDGLEKIKELSRNKKSKLVVFATGATPSSVKEEIDKIMENNFRDSSIPHFYFQSGLCYEKMGVADKTIMKMLSKILSSKENQTDIENGFATAISKSYDISDKSYIMPLVNFVRQQQ